MRRPILGSLLLFLGCASVAAQSDTDLIVTGVHKTTGAYQESASTLDEIIALSGTHPVDLTSDTTGLLPTGSGGTGQATLDDTLGTANEVDVANGAGTVVGGDQTLSLSSTLVLPGTASIAGNLTLSSFTEGSVLYAGPGGLVSESNPGIFWDSATDTLAIGDNDHGIIVDGFSVDTGMIVHREGGLEDAEYAAHRHSDTAGVASVYYGARSRGTDDSPTIVSDGDWIAKFIGVAYDGVDYPRAGRLVLVVDGTPGADDMPGEWVFGLTPDGSTTPVDVFWIKQDGKVAIGGTGDPSELFEVSLATTDAGDDGAVLSLVRDDPGVGGGGEPLGSIKFQDTDGGLGEGARLAVVSQGAHSVSAKGSEFVFSVVEQGTTTLVERMRLNEDGVLTLTDEIDGDGTGTNTLAGNLDIEGALFLGENTVLLSADDQVISLTDASLIFIISNSGVAADRTFSFSGGTVGQLIYVFYDDGPAAGGNKAELLDTATMTLDGGTDLTFDGNETFSFLVADSAPLYAMQSFSNNPAF